MPEEVPTPKPEFPIKVMVPSYGVLTQVVGTTVRVAVGDDGGTGWPWKAVFIPVVEDGDRLFLFDIAAGEKVDSPVLAHFDRLAEKRDIARADGWYAFDIPVPQWPRSPYGVLVLLFYFQAKGIGPNEPRPWDHAPATEATPADPNWQEAFLHVAARLKGNPVRVLLPAVLRVALPSAPPNQSRSPGPAPGIASFALASCAYPGDLLDRSPRFSQTSGDGPADASLMRLASRLESRNDPNCPRFLVLAGDQIYVDATAGMFDPTVVDDAYRNSYQGFFGSRGARAVFNQLPVFMMLDDHEIADNWAPESSPDNDKNQKLMRCGRDAYWKHQRDAGPPPTDPADRSVLWACIQPEGLPIFMADTRTQRQARSAQTFLTSNIVDEPQFEALTTWLLLHKADPHPSFVVSPSMLLPRPLGVKGEPSSALHCDAWAGYPCSLHRLLAFLCENDIGNAVFLSGDEHLSCCARATVARKGGGGPVVNLLSIHSSALYAPYPFANAVAEDFARCEEFDFVFPGPLAHEYECKVSTKFPVPGDGFAVVSVETLATPHWRLTVLFDRAQPNTAENTFIFNQP